LCREFKLNRNNVPLKVKERKIKRNKNFLCSTLVSDIQWSNKKTIEMITAMKHYQSPQCEVSKFMGGNERKDQLLPSYLIERKKMNKYYMKMIIRLLNVTVLNAMAICRKI
jgi:hypothetical protein